MMLNTQTEKACSKCGVVQPLDRFCKSSGANDGIPANFNISLSVSASPMRSWPWLGMPIISPAQASSANSRSAAKNNIGDAIAIIFFVRT